MQIKFLIKKVKTTLHRQGVLGVTTKTVLRLNSARRRLFVSNSSNKKEWKQLHNKFKGQRVFLIGNGPSLNKTPLYLLKDEHTICFNHFYLFEERLNWIPTFYCITDNLVVKDLLDQLTSLIEKYKFNFFPDIHFRGENFKNQIKPSHKVYWLNQVFGEGFSEDMPKVYPGGSVIYEGFQILNYLGFDEIYFLGVDMNFKIHKTAEYLDKKLKSVDIISQENDDPNHFDPRYFGKNKKYHQPEAFVIDNILFNLKYLSSITDKMHLEIYNAGIDSKVDFFKKKKLEDVLGLSELQKRNLFEDLIRVNSKFSSISEFEALNARITRFEPNLLTKSYFYTSAETGVELISTMVFTHLSLGPFNNNYYFVKRKV